MNRVSSISKEKAGKIKTTNAYIVELDGNKIKYSNDFLFEMSKAFDFPYEPDNYPGFIDYITDLSWISEKEIILFIYDYSIFMREDLVFKRELKESFEEDVLPFWEEEVMHTVVDGQPRTFNVYLVD